MKKILVPIDFSAASMNAMNFALDMAHSTDAELALFHVFEIPILYPETAMITGDEIEQMKVIKSEMEEVKKDLLRKNRSSVSITTEVRSGIVLSEIKNYAFEIDAFAIIMGSGGKNSLERFIFGSKTSSIIKTVSIPVIIVPKGAKYKKIEKIAFACDLEHFDPNLPLDEIQTIVKLFNAEFYILSINGEPNQGLSEGGRRELKMLTDKLKDAKPIFNYEFNKDVAAGIQEFSENMNIDLLIIVPKTYPLLKDLFHKSNSTAVLTHTHLPVMSIHE